jgi:RimJ/RimL family protein N-acetyltransferase
VKPQVTLRRVCDSDCRLLWEWANDPVVRQQSFNSEPIPWETHLSWFTRKCEDPNCYHFLGLNEAGHPVGQVRFDVADETEVSIGIGGPYRGRGYGSSLLKLASAELVALTGLERINAYIKPDNMPSLGAFARAGYVRAGKTYVRGQEAVWMVLLKDNQRECTSQEALGG